MERGRGHVEKLIKKRGASHPSMARAFTIGLVCFPCLRMSDTRMAHGEPLQTLEPFTGTGFSWCPERDLNPQGVATRGV
jgi:hypothetical protein